MSPAASTKVMSRHLFWAYWALHDVDHFRQSLSWIDERFVMRTFSGVMVTTARRRMFEHPQMCYRRATRYLHGLTMQGLSRLCGPLKGERKKENRKPVVVEWWQTIELQSCDIRFDEQERKIIVASVYWLTIVQYTAVNNITVETEFDTLVHIRQKPTGERSLRHVEIR
jgi:hypothetical protein